MKLDAKTAIDILNKNEATKDKVAQNIDCNPSELSTKKSKISILGITLPIKESSSKQFKLKFNKKVSRDVMLLHTTTAKSLSDVCEQIIGSVFKNQYVTADKCDYTNNTILATVWKRK